MIPKVIHYFWFGGNEKPDIVNKCIESWKRYCSDWEIKEWNEDNFDVTSIPYMREAYEHKKWAFVSDVARLIIIYKYGGVYLDTDVEVLSQNPFDEWLVFDNFFVFDTERTIATGLCFGGGKKSALCIKLLKPYLNIQAFPQKPKVNSMMNKPVFVSEFPQLIWNAKNQIIGNIFFCGHDEYSKRMKHYGTKTWCDNLPNYRISKIYRLKKVLRRPKNFEFLEKNKFFWRLVPIYEFVVYDFLDLGITYYIKRTFIKLRSKRN